MQDQDSGLNVAEAAAQALRDSVSRARQMVEDAKRVLEQLPEPNPAPEDSELAVDEA